MSYNIDGKVANQAPRNRFNSGDPKPTCEKCCTLIDGPLTGGMSYHNQDKTQSGCYIYQYIGTEHFIYETKSGQAVVYCSDHCRRKHNHRFKNG